MAAAGIVVALVAGAAYAIVHTHDDARAQLRAQLGQRASLAARFTDELLRNEPQRAAAETSLEGPERGLARELAIYQGDDPLPRAYVLDGKGRVLAADPPSIRREPGLADRLHVRTALGGVQALSTVFPGPGGASVVEVAIPYRTEYGLRVFVLALPLEVVQATLGRYLPNALAVTGGRAYLLDSSNHVTASVETEIGAVLDDRALLAGLRRAPQGGYGDREFVSAAVGKTGWRVVFTVPAKALYASVDGASRRTTWGLFAAFVGALVVLLGVGATALRRSARLAHERLHDALTGLPNRALFLDRVERALAGVHRGGVPAAVLFVDLDRFKHVNDTLGHAAGDAVLMEAAQRLSNTVRWVDTVCRFGGDEFLVLCEQVCDEQEAVEIASRLQEELARPIAIGAREVTIGCSIGVAAHGPDQEPITAATIVQRADMAMYRAKQRDRAEVELFETVPASPGA